ncbi:hypothetical protein GE09DRAFT_1234173 [Coniochaeta sp. 2T2.1]|nr:hypothetical protein GE09DRAFT_1234173 [Coniochaeta sp. 2T2.1]
MRAVMKVWRITKKPSTTKMPSLVFARPSRPAREVSRPYSQLNKSEKTLDLCFDILKEALISTEDGLIAWRDERDKRLGVKRPLHKMTWRGSRKREDTLLNALETTHKALQTVYVQAGYQLRHGKHSWHDGDEEVYASLMKQRRILLDQVQQPLQHSGDSSHINELAAAQLDDMIAAVHLVRRETVAALVAFYDRVRLLWTHRTRADLPSPFCPLALEAQTGSALLIVPVETEWHPPHKQRKLSDSGFKLPLQEEEQRFSWICPRCCGLVVQGALEHLKARHSIGELFAAHLRPRVRGEGVRHACPRCHKVYDTLEAYWFYHGEDVSFRMAQSAEQPQNPSYILVTPDEPGKPYFVFTFTI